MLPAIDVLFPDLSYHVCIILHHRGAVVHWSCEDRNNRRACATL